MAVYAYLGLPGSGKSFHVLKDTILKALHDGRRVFHNLPLKFNVIEGVEFHIGYLRRRLIEVNQNFLFNLPKYEKVLRGSLLVIDEAHETFWTGDKIKDEKLRNFWTWHRHLKMDIVVLTQDADNLAKIIKGVVALRYEFRNMGFLGFNSAYEIRQYEGISGKVQVGIKRGRFDKKYFPYYESVTGGGVTSLFKIKAPLNFSIYKWSILLVGGPVLILYLFFQLSFFDKMAEGEGKPPLVKVGSTANETVKNPVNTGQTGVIKYRGSKGGSLPGSPVAGSGRENSNRVNTGRVEGSGDPNLEKVRFNSEDQGQVDFPLFLPGRGPGGLDLDKGRQRGTRARDLVKEFYSGLVMSIASEDIEGQDVKPGRYKVNGVIGYGGNFMYLVRSMEGVSARFRSTRELLIDSIVRVY